MVFPLTIDATPLNYNSFLPDRRQKNSLKSTLVQQENLKGTRNLTQQDIQTPSHFINEEIVEIIVTTTQQSISPIHPNLITPKRKISILPQVTLQSTVKPLVAPKYSHMDYQTFRPMTNPPQKQRIFTRSNFAEHNYNYVNRSQTSKPPLTNPHNRSCSQRQNSHKQITPYYTPNCLSSDDDDFYDQNHQQNFQNQRLDSYHVNQPDFFEPYTREQHMRQPRSNHAPQNNNFYSQNPANFDYYQPTQMQNEIPLPYYLQQHEITKNQLTSFIQMPNAAESLQMTMNPYLMGGSSITSNKPLMVFTGTDPEYSVEDYLNAVTANLILNIGPEPNNTPLHQRWIHRRTALIQTTLDDAAQKWFSVLPIDIKTDWKRFTQEFSKMFDYERNKQHQRVLWNEIRRLPNETFKQLAVRIETLVRKAYSRMTHDYKNTKMTEILMMTLTPQLKKIAIRKRASHPSSIREPDIGFRKLVDKLEQAEITMKLEETENFELKYVNRIETNTTHVNNIHDSDVDLTEKITEILNLYEKNSNFKGKPTFKK